MRYVFFSMRDFEIDGGGSIRMCGILNALAQAGHEVIFISNANNYSKFHPAINHITIDYQFNDKARLQGLSGILPAHVTVLFYPDLFSKIKAAIQKANIQNTTYECLIFCEYLDNTIAYLLKRTNVIKRYINDIHGIATLEFKYQKEQAKSFFQKLIYSLKYFLTDALDRKVFSQADGFIYASQSMQEFYESRYSKAANKKAYIVPYLLSKQACVIEPDLLFQAQLAKELRIEPNDFVFFFAGGYKPTAGVEDLITAFSKLYTFFTNIKLILIGTGSSYAKCVKMVEELELKLAVTFIETIPYHQLKTYQSLANVVVCPDRFNDYSELIVHLKYFDCLLSGKIVINGSFTSVKEINKDDILSLSFEPSDVDSLQKTMEKCLVQYEELCFKYQGTKEFAIKNLTYESYINQLIN